MIKTAFKPFWLLMLVLALGVAGAFVWLSVWQFGSAETAPPPPRAQTENAVPLTGHLDPGEAVTSQTADQVVTVSGQFVAGSDVLVDGRLADGVDGTWTVAALRVDGAPGDEVIPVVRGWSEDPRAGMTDPAPAGDVEVTGRLLPPEGPLPPEQPLSGDEADDAAGRPVLASLSPAQLVNLWDAPGYGAFVVAFAVEGPEGEDLSVGAADGGLEPVWVGPQPEETSVIWMNVFYGVEWAVFAGFALFLWWRFVKDDHLRELREEELDREWERQWRAEELQRRRDAAARAKLNARAAYAAYVARHGDPAASRTQTQRDDEES